MLSVLRTVIRGLGYTYLDVATKLDLSSGYLSRLFSGKIELKFDHIVEISRALGFEPEEVIQLAFPQRKGPPSEAALRYQALAQSSSGASLPMLGGPGVSEEEIERVVLNVLRKLVDAQAPSQSPGPSEEELEQLMDRKLRKFFGGLAQNQAG